MIGRKKCQIALITWRGPDHCRRHHRGSDGQDRHSERSRLRRCSRGRSRPHGSRFIARHPYITAPLSAAWVTLCRCDASPTLDKDDSTGFAAHSPASRQSPLLVSSQIIVCNDEFSPRTSHIPPESIYLLSMHLLAFPCPGIQTCETVSFNTAPQCNMSKRRFNPGSTLTVYHNHVIQV